jgi:hypothetical protein
MVRLSMIKHFRIINMQRGNVLTTVCAKTERGAILVFRKTYRLEHNYPWICAIEWKEEGE